jgi:hypothetical protein
MAGNRAAYQAQKRHQTEDRPEGSGNVAQHPLAPPEDPAGNSENLLKGIRIEGKRQSIRNKNQE